MPWGLLDPCGARGFATEKDDDGDSYGHLPVSQRESAAIRAGSCRRAHPVRVFAIVVVRTGNSFLSSLTSSEWSMPKSPIFVVIFFRSEVSNGVDREARS